MSLSLILHVPHMGAGDSGMRQTQAFPRGIPSHRLMGRLPRGRDKETGSESRLGATVVKDWEGAWQAFPQLYPGALRPD